MKKLPLVAETSATLTTTKLCSNELTNSTEIKLTETLEAFKHRAIDYEAVSPFLVIQKQ